MQIQGNGHANGAAAHMAKSKVRKVVAPKAFGAALKAARVAAGLKARQLAEAIGEPVTGIYRWEAGDCLPCDAAMVKLLARFPELPSSRAIPLFAAPPPIVVASAKPAKKPRAPVAAVAVVPKPHLAREASTVSLGDYAEAVGAVEAARRVLETAIEHAELIHTRLMGRSAK